MILESTLTRREFTRHALSRHFRRPIFYVFAMLAAIMTAYTMYDPTAAIIPALAAGWVPFLVYAVVGFVAIPRSTRNPELPVYLPTRYDISSNRLTMSVAVNSPGRISVAGARISASMNWCSSPASCC